MKRKAAVRASKAKKRACTWAEQEQDRTDKRRERGLTREDNSEAEGEQIGKQRITCLVSFI